VSLAVDGQDRSTDATGNGPVDALYSAVDQALQPALGWHPVLTQYEIKAVSAGEDAQGQVLVRCRRSSDEGPGALVVSGHGLSTNIIEASLEAYLSAVNKLHGAEINGVSVAFVAPRIVEESPGGWHRGALPPTSEGGRPLHEEGGRS
jgi:2-isopropylmalate synthase